MPWPSTPAAPLLAETFSQATSSVAGAHTLSIRLYQRPPLTPLTSADTMRTVQTEASTHDQLRASAPCVALAGTADALCASFRSIPHPPSYPPSLDAALLSALFTAYRRSSTMRALTPAAPRQRDRSLHSIHSPSGHPIPTHVVRPNVTPITSCARSAPRGTRLRQAGASSPLLAAESGSCFFRLSIRLRLLPTPPRGDAVAFGYICGDFT